MFLPNPSLKGNSWWLLKFRHMVKYKILFFDSILWAGGG